MSEAVLNQEALEELDEVELNGMGWDGMGWDGMGWDGMQRDRKDVMSPVMVRPVRWDLMERDGAG